MTPEELMTTYAWALDTGDWPLLDQVFTDDASMDFTTYAGLVRGRTEIRKCLRRILEPLDRTQHVITNVRITGTAASAYYQAHHARFACEPPVYTVTGVYHVALLETAEERRISHLRPEVLWTQGNPEVVNTTSSSTGHQAP